jgi:hypothetical protein
MRSLNLPRKGLAGLIQPLIALYLNKLQFNRSGTAKDADKHPELAAIRANFFNDPVKVYERAVNDLDALAHREKNSRFGFDRPLFHLLGNFFDLLVV